MQTIVLLLWLAVVVVAFLVYPRVMLRVCGALVRGVLNLVVDALGLLLAWI